VVRSIRPQAALGRHAQWKEPPGLAVDGGCVWLGHASTVSFLD
jgi:hypothetical protein